jgi:hypothetical protein
MGILIFSSKLENTLKWQRSQGIQNPFTFDSPEMAL